MKAVKLFFYTQEALRICHEIEKHFSNKVKFLILPLEKSSHKECGVVNCVGYVVPLDFKSNLQEVWNYILEINRFKKEEVFIIFIKSKYSAQIMKLIIDVFRRNELVIDRFFEVDIDICKNKVEIAEIRSYLQEKLNST